MNVHALEKNLIPKYTNMHLDKIFYIYVLDIGLGCIFQFKCCVTHLWVLCYWNFYIMSEIHNSLWVPLSMTEFPLKLHTDCTEKVFTYYGYSFTISTMFTVFTIFNLYLVSLNPNLYFPYYLFYLSSSIYYPETILYLLSLVQGTLFF